MLAPLSIDCEHTIDRQASRPFSGETPLRRVFFDCTATFSDDVNTGIQRVVRNVVNTASQVGLEFGLECRGVVFDQRQGFVPIDRLPTPVPAPISLQQAGEGLARRIRSRAKEWLAAAHLLESVRSARRWLKDVRYQMLLPARRRSQHSVRWRPGDALIMIDTSWLPGFPWIDICELQAQGAVVGTVLYDLIPLQFPEVVGEGTKEQYGRWWRKARTVSDFVIGISRSVLDDIEAVDAAQRTAGAPAAPLQTAYFRLGAELDPLAQIGSVREEFRRAFDDLKRLSTEYSVLGTQRAGNLNRPSACLMVGMISPRKNHALALDAFDRLWASGSAAKLVIAGRYGWDCRPLMDRIHRHPELGRKLFWFEDVSDADLDFAYRHAAALIAPSYAEGFNLPIVEALHRGCPVVASDVPVHREVGGEFAAFFPLGDAAALAALVAQQQQTGTLPGVRPAGEFHWPDWTESCRELLRKVRQIAIPADLTADPRRVTRTAA